MSPEVGSLEDPNEGRPVHMRARKRRLYHSDAVGKMITLKIMFRLNFLRKVAFA